MARKEGRIVDDLSEEEYNDYEKHPENWEDVTNNTIDYYRELTGVDDED